MCFFLKLTFLAFGQQYLPLDYCILSVSKTIFKRFHVEYLTFLRSSSSFAAVKLLNWPSLSSNSIRVSVPAFGTRLNIKNVSFADMVLFSKSVSYRVIHICFQRIPISTIILLHNRSETKCSEIRYFGTKCSKSYMAATVGFWQAPLPPPPFFYFSKSSQGPILGCLASRGGPVLVDQMFW